jgi:hypothetical protein
LPKNIDSRPGGRIARKDPGDGHRLLDRILSTPDLARVVPQLQASVLHRVIEHCGLEDCSEIVALATPAQLAQVFDLDLWRAPQPGRDEQFDPARFGLWLEVLIESGAGKAAELLVAMPIEPLVSGIAHHVRVFDLISTATHETTNGGWYCHRSTADELTSDIGGYQLMAKRTDTWDAINEVLTTLATDHADCFHHIMRGVVACSNAGREVDASHDLLETEAQAIFDMTADRDERREQQGYATPAQARAFLQMARQGRVDAGDDPIARAYFRAIEAITDRPSTRVESRDASINTRSGQAPDPIAPAEVVEMLVDAGLLPQPPQALLTGSHDASPDRLAKMRSQMQHVFERDPVIYSTRSAEIAFLANTLAAGCTIQSRAFAPHEASEAAIAVCNLALDRMRDLPHDHLLRHDLIGVFQIGWQTLHEDVALSAAEQLIDILTRFRISDCDIQADLNFLRVEMMKQWRAGTPWKARGRLETIAMLDAPAWAALTALIDECPVLHAAIQAGESRAHRIEMSRFVWISDGSDLAVIRKFMQALPETLGLE